MADRRSTKVAQAEEQQKDAHGQIEVEEDKPMEFQEPAKDPEPTSPKAAKTGLASLIAVKMASDVKRKIEISRKEPTTNLRKDDLDDEAPEGESSMN